VLFWTPKKLKTDNMGPKKRGVSRTVLTIETKQEIIAKVESGQKMSDIARQYGLNRSTVGTILAKKDIIKKTQKAKGVTKITSEKQRSAIHEEMERLLLVWINEREMKRDVTSMAIIQEKAREIFEKLKRQTPGSSSKELEFKVPLAGLQGLEGDLALTFRGPTSYI